jgi:hypothetical protein
MNQFVSLKLKVIVTYCGRFRYSARSESRNCKIGFDLLGWEHFAAVVLFAGHGSHSANNAFDLA